MMIALSVVIIKDTDKGIRIATAKVTKKAISKALIRIYTYLSYIKL